MFDNIIEPTSKPILEDVKETELITNEDVEILPVINENTFESFRISSSSMDSNEGESCVTRFFKYLNSSGEDPIKKCSDSSFNDDSSFLMANSHIRGHWNKKIDFLLTCIGYAVGISNIWRFPFKVLKNGGAVYLVAYIIMLVIIAIPLFIAEMAYAQFSSRGITECWHFAPGLKGIGYLMLMMSWLCSLYYNLVVGWTIYYMACSLVPTMPWTTCTNWWNDNRCFSTVFLGVMTNASDQESSSEQFWLRNVVTRVETLNRSTVRVWTISDSPQTIVWYTALSMMTAWLLCGLILMNGINSTAQAMYFLATYPYLIIFVLIVLGSWMEGSINGLRFYIMPEFQRFFRFGLWHDAAEQIFYSLGIGTGGLMTYASYNSFTENVERDAVIVSVINAATSIIGGIAVFEMLGFMAYRYNLEMDELFKYAEDGLIFIAYPESLSNLYGSNLLCFLFFLMALALGIDSQVGMIETVLTGFMDEFPVLHKKRYRVMLVWLVHVVCNVLSLLLVTRTGYYWFIVMSYYSLGTNLLIVGCIEGLIFSYVYGYKQLDRDYAMMRGAPLKTFWKFCLMTTVPGMCFILTVTAIFNFKPTEIGYNFHRIMFPSWADAIGWSIVGVTLIPLPIFFLYYLYIKMWHDRLSFSAAFSSAFRPDLNWGPGIPSNWFINKHYKNKYKKFKKNPKFIFYRAPNTLGNIYSMTNI